MTNWAPLLLLFAGLASCSAPPQQHDSSQAVVCRLHGAELETVLVPVENGCIGPMITGYKEARAERFPNAVVPQLHGRAHEITYEVHCRQCTYAELDWIFEVFGGGLVIDRETQLPTYYEVPPNKLLQQTALRAAAEQRGR